MGKLITDILFNHLDYLYYLNDFFIQDDQKKTFTISYYNGDTLITTQTVVQGQSGNYTGETPTKEQDAQYTYTFSGWSESNDNTVDVDVLTNITADKNVYACFTETLRTYTVTWKNGDTILEIDSNVPYGTIPSYNSTTPAKTQTAQYTYTFAGWSKTDDNTVDANALTAITGDRSVYACFTETVRTYTVTFVKESADGGGTLQTINNVAYGTVVTAASAYTGTTPTTTKGDAADYPFEGWDPASATVQSDIAFIAKFDSPIKEITDSWDTIIANIDNGTYATKYKIGNYKPIDLGSTYGTAINMQIVAIDGDELADGSGYAPLTFISKELLLTTSKMNSTRTNANGYPATTAMKPLLDNTIYSLISSNIRGRIQEVNKTYYDGTSHSTKTNAEKIWPPSRRELCGIGSYLESSGVKYKTIFTDNASRIKKIGETAQRWWTRSSSDNGVMFFRVDGSGSFSSTYADTAHGVCFGFCLGLEPETITDDWSTILANSSPSTSYSIGDTKYLNLGTEGKHLMEIVAFDTDDKADGSGKAKITWISKTLLNTTRRMNPTNSSGAIGTGGNGGWLNCEMRTYLKETIKPLIPETVRNGIVEVTKVQSTVTNGTMVKDGQTSTEDVWIPSNHEVFSTVTTYESTGATYTKFASDADRIKKTLSGTAYGWGLRSASSSTTFRRVTYDGISTNVTVSVALRVALGFCTD